MQQNNSNLSQRGKSQSTDKRRYLKHRVFCAISGIDPEGEQAAEKLARLLFDVSMRARAQSLGIDKNASAKEMNRIQSNNEHRRQCLFYAISPDSTGVELHRARCLYWQVPPALAVDRKSLNRELSRRKAQIGNQDLV